MKTIIANDFQKRTNDSHFLLNDIPDQESPQLELADSIPSGSSAYNYSQKSTEMEIINNDFEQNQSVTPTKHNTSLNDVLDWPKTPERKTKNITVKKTFVLTSKEWHDIEEVKMNAKNKLVLEKAARRTQREQNSKVKAKSSKLITKSRKISQNTNKNRAVENLPVQEPNECLNFEGTLPPKINKNGSTSTQFYSKTSCNLVQKPTKLKIITLPEKEKSIGKENEPSTSNNIFQINSASVHKSVEPKIKIISCVTLKKPFQIIVKKTRFR